MSRSTSAPQGDAPVLTDPLPAAIPGKATVPRILVVFLDGVGIGEPDPEVNPFLRAELPVLSGALGGTLPTLADLAPFGLVGRTHLLDACLGVPGTPQSGTGQVALLTGKNAAEILGRHFGPWPPVRLRPLLEEENFLRRAVEMGGEVVFANAYPEGYPGDRPARRVAAPPIAARAAGILDRDHRALAEGRAVASEIVNDGWIEFLQHAEIPRVTPEEAGANLAKLAGGADLTFFAHYETDLAGHRGGMDGAIAALERVDRFLGGLLANLPSDLLVLVSSDHGNLEDIRGGHTRNPALGLALGPHAATVPPLRSLLGVAEFVLAQVEARVGAMRGG